MDRNVFIRRRKTGSDGADVTSMDRPIQSAARQQ